MVVFRTSELLSSRYYEDCNIANPLTHKGDGAYNSENASPKGIVGEFNATDSSRELLGEPGMKRALQGAWSYSFRAAAMISAKLGGEVTNSPEGTVWAASYRT